MKLSTTPVRLAAASLAVGLVAAALAAPAQDTKPTPPTRTPPTSAPATPPTSPPTSAPAKDLPAAKKILAKTVKAMGGKEALAKIKSGHTKAKLSSPMAQMDLETHWHEPGMMLMSQTIAGMGEISIGYDGKVGWMTNPMTGQYELLDDEQIDQMKGQATIHVTLANVEKEFDLIETVDLTDFDGRPCFKLQVVEDKAKQEVAAKPDETYLYVDEKTSLFAGMESSGETQMGPMTMSITFHDWKEIDGVKFFRKMMATQMGMEMQIDYTMIELNKVDPGIFEPPAEVKELAEQRKKAATSRPETPAGVGGGVGGGAGGG